jgi:hypothetical protein
MYARHCRQNPAAESGTETVRRAAEISNFPDRYSLPVVLAEDDGLHGFAA